MLSGVDCTDDLLKGGIKKNGKDVQHGGSYHQLKFGPPKIIGAHL